jgi:hypothetical protein
VATNNSQSHRSRWLVLALSATAGIWGVRCGFSDPVTTGNGGSTSNGTNPMGTSGAGVIPVAGNTGNNTGGTGQTTPTAGTGQTLPTAGTGQANPTGGTGAGGAGAGGSDANPTGGTGAVVGTFKNYSVTGTWPNQPVAIPTAPGKLTYTKVTLHDRFLAESCSIADYNEDGEPDVSAGRRWYQGPFGPGMPVVEHIFRGGHDDLPKNGDMPEIDTGVSDDWGCYPYDVDKDGHVDIINISNCDVPENKNPNPQPAPQPKASAFWYKNPGGAAAGTSMWQGYSMHTDVRLEQHGLVDVNGDGYPEIYGACKGCTPAQRKGYYQGDPANPTAGWTFHPVTRQYEFPFSGTGWLHGLGFGDVNGDGKPDLLERGGIWLDALAAAPNETKCPGANCGFIEQQLYGGGAGGELGGSHMFAFDVDGDGDGDVVSADFAHAYGISWYENMGANTLTFTKRQFVGGPQDVGKYGVQFSEPHAMQVADMDGDGVPDIVVGKMRFAHPNGYGDPDLLGDPVIYVFKTKRNTPSAANGGSVTFEPHLIDTSPVGMKSGVGRQVAVGHVNKDGIMDVCAATKLGLYVFLGQ